MPFNDQTKCHHVDKELYSGDVYQGYGSSIFAAGIPTSFLGSLVFPSSFPPGDRIKRDPGKWVIRFQSPNLTL